MSSTWQSIAIAEVYLNSSLIVPITLPFTLKRTFSPAAVGLLLAHRLNAARVWNMGNQHKPFAYPTYSLSKKNTAKKTSFIVPNNNLA